MFTELGSGLCTATFPNTRGKEERKGNRVLVWEEHPSRSLNPWHWKRAQRSPDLQFQGKKSQALLQHQTTKQELIRVGI